MGSDGRAGIRDDKMKTIDLHCDTIMRFYGGEPLNGMENSHINLEKLQKGGCLAQCFAIFVPTGKAAERMGITDTPEAYFDKAYAAYLREMERNQDCIQPAFCAADILSHDAEGKMSAVLTVEDGVTLNGEIGNVDEYYRKGVRMVALTWNFENSLGYPQSKDPALHKLGLKPFGIEAVRRMNELGIAVDVSHLSEGGFWDVARYSTKPMIASHSCCRAYRDISRNLTDEQIRAIGESGGVIGVNYANDFLRDVTDYKTDRLTSIRDVVKHMRHIADLAGIDTLALGSDYDGIHSQLEWQDCGGTQQLVDVVIKEFGLTGAEKICNKNALRVFYDIFGA